MSFISMSSSTVESLSNACLDKIWDARAEEYLADQNTFFRSLFNKVFNIESPDKEQVIDLLKLNKSVYWEYTSKYSCMEATALKLLIAAKYADTIEISVDDLGELA